MSAASPAAFPPDDRPEIAVVGRSNVGKSSAINALANRKRLAIASKTPGRTRTINFFELGSAARVVDLPGYGYAAIPHAVRARWDKLISAYFSGRRSLVAVVLLMDARRPLTEQDRRMLAWLRPFGARLLVLLSKSDRLSRAAAGAAQLAVRRALAEELGDAEVIAFSATHSTGVAQARRLLEQWLGESVKEKGLRESAPAARNKRPPAKGKATGGEAP
ncbi:MAG: ribosome biogenesis GTP-binding protein YihA/YsxC [Burkholderiales bacterium]|nr:ribosome biogenesis GTP-binding protein YihA/YsxC [Burkholderiales bacterium]